MTQQETLEFIRGNTTLILIYNLPYLDLKE